MYTPKENYIRTLENDHPDRLVSDYEAFAAYLDPIYVLDRISPVPGKSMKDSFGTTVIQPEGHAGLMPIVNDELKVIKDVTKWKEQLKVPDYNSYNLDWSEINDYFKTINRDEQLTTVIMTVGLFERLHFLMGVEDALVNLIIEPEAMHELLDVLLENRIEHAKQVIDNCNPDAIIYHDDWGTKRSLYISPDTWREFFKERSRKLYEYIKGRGVHLIHHSDSYCQPIVKDMAEIGIRCWQGVIPDNDIQTMQKELKGSMLLMGGINSIIDKINWSEEEIRKEVRKACETYGPGGNFAPCLTYGGPGSINPGVDDIIHDEIAGYNKDVYGIG